MNQLRQYQQEGVTRMLALQGDIILADEPGLGKALVNGTRVSTPRGWISIEELQSGDQVHNTAGGVSAVTGVFPQGRRECVAVVFSDGSRVECSADHLWTVRTKRDRMLGRRGQVLSASEIAEGLKTVAGRRRYFVETCNPVIYKAQGERLIAPYQMGMLLANGGLSQGTVRLSCGDVEVVERFAKQVIPGYRLSRISQFDWAITGAYAGSPNAYRRELDRLGLRCLSCEKHIPPEYLYAADRLELLHGLMDGDGFCSSGGTCQYNTSSPRLAEGVRTLVESFGGVVRVSSKKTGYRKGGEFVQCRIGYTLTINFPEGLRLFALDRKENRRVSKKYHPTRAIESVEARGWKECTCISVDAPDHLFLTEHYIPTHNTVQVIEYVNRTKPQSFVVVCPASLRINWNKEINKWLDPALVRRADGSQRYGVFSYEQLTRLVVTPSETWLGLVTPNPPLLIIDEAHYLKNPSALRTKAVLGAKETEKQPAVSPLPAVRRIFMTGTPIINRPLDLWPMLEAMGTKMTYRQYGKRYCGGVLKPIKWSKARKVNGKYIPARPVKFAWDYTGASNLEELGNALRKHCTIRRLKKDVLKELPPKVRQVIEIDAPHGESATLREAVSRMFNSLTEANANTGELIKVAFEELSKARLELARRKLPHVLAFLKDVLLEEEEKVVVFAYHREIIDAICADLYKSGIPCVKFDGGMNDRDKDASVQLFQHGLHRVFVGQIIAAGTGITLTAALTVLFAELDWVPGNVIQAEDRCHRIGQKSTVRAFHVVLKDSADGRVVRALVTKQNTIEGVMG